MLKKITHSYLRIMGALLMLATLLLGITGCSLLFGGETDTDDTNTAHETTDTQNEATDTKDTQNTKDTQDEEGDGNAMSSAIKEITASQQASGNLRFTNYQAIIYADVDWNNLSNPEKQEIIDYVFKESRKLAAENGVDNYNIVGISEDGVSLFLWDRNNNEVLIYIGGEPASERLPAPAE